MLTISFFNGIGTTNKTTSVLATGGVLCDLGKNILFVDYGQYSDLSENVSSKIDDMSVLDFVLPNKKNKFKIAKRNKIDIIVADSLTQQINSIILGTMFGDSLIKKNLAMYSDIYDYAILDTPYWGNESLNTSILVASDIIIIPMNCDYRDIWGLEHIYNKFISIKNHLNKKIGILICNHDKNSKVETEAVEDIILRSAQYNIPIFSTRISKSLDFKHAQNQGNSIIEYNSLSSGANEYRQFVSELINL